MFEYALSGFFIALAIGLTGVGAGTLTAPLLILLGLDPAKAVGSALSFSAFVKFPAFVFHALYKNIDYKTLFLMLSGGVPGVLLGSFLLSFLSHEKGLKNVLFLIIGFTILLSIALNLFTTLRNKRLDLTRYKFLLPFACFFIGLEVGFTSAGAGALGMVLLLYFTRLEPSRAVGVDIAFGLACSSLGSLFHFLGSNINPEVFIPMSFGGLLGVWLGTHLTRKINPKPIRVLISFLLLLVAINLINRGINHG